MGAYDEPSGCYPPDCWETSNPTPVPYQVRAPLFMLSGGFAPVGSGAGSLGVVPASWASPTVFTPASCPAPSALAMLEMDVTVGVSTFTGSVMFVGPVAAGEAALAAGSGASLVWAFFRIIEFIFCFFEM